MPEVACRFKDGKDSRTSRAVHHDSNEAEQVDGVLQPCRKVGLRQARFERLDEHGRPQQHSRSLMTRQDMAQERRLRFREPFGARWLASWCARRARPISTLPDWPTRVYVGKGCTNGDRDEGSAICSVCVSARRAPEGDGVYQSDAVALQSATFDGSALP